MKILKMMKCLDEQIYIDIKDVDDEEDADVGICKTLKRISISPDYDKTIWCKKTRSLIHEI